MEYNPAFAAQRAILSETDKRALHALSQAYTLNRFRADARNYEEMRVDFVYTSARIEGNTYDRIDTDNLLRIGITAGGKRYSDAVMLINLRDGFVWRGRARPRQSDKCVRRRG
ncbi:Putative Tou1 (fragment) [Candidatus Glomeribacter gigasporarum BEG34]|uniref:Putative Tou1 n=1 Tax=Candidatus Glomeribacter gigasporarum BEG34 TaxID=1070319 RepID=G2J838_9BURK